MNAQVEVKSGGLCFFRSQPHNPSGELEVSFHKLIFHFEGFEKD